MHGRGRIKAVALQARRGIIKKMLPTIASPRQPLSIESVKDQMLVAEENEI